MQDFECDADNEKRHVAKHGIAFSTASRIWENAVFKKPDRRRDYREERFIAVGKVEERILVVVYTWRGARRRIISARKASSRERTTYEEEAERRSHPSAD